MFALPGFSQPGHQTRATKTNKNNKTKGKTKMKTRSTEEKPRGTDGRSKRQSRRWLASAVLATGALLVSSLLNHSAAAGTANACQKTAAEVLAGCRAGVQSDYRIALGKCVNISDQAARTACQQQAVQDLHDGQRTCQDQYAARQAACQKLGPAPYDPVIDPANFVAQVDNPYFPLVPGTTFIYEGRSSQGFSHIEFAVTHNTKVILGVTCVEIHDSVFLNGVLEEDTLDWFAQDKEGNVWYFGENTHELVDGLITTIAGTFIAGENGDKAGIIMKAHPAVGDFYRQEFSLANAEDFAETLSITESVTVRYGSFNHCLKSQETTPLETSLLEHKFYAPGVGQILTVNANTGERTDLVQIITK